MNKNQNPLDILPLKKILYEIVLCKDEKIIKEMLIDIRKLLMKNNIPDNIWYIYLLGLASGYRDL